jgi:hypothetical protein
MKELSFAEVNQISGGNAVAALITTLATSQTLSPYAAAGIGLAAGAICGLPGLAFGGFTLMAAGLVAAEAAAGAVVGLALQFIPSNS